MPRSRNDWRPLPRRICGRWRLFPNLILVAAVLYAKSDPSNHRYQDSRMLSRALKIGDLLADDRERDKDRDRPNSDRETYMWLEAYRLLESKLGKERRKRWRGHLEKSIADLVAEVAQRMAFPGYQSPFIGTSPNHLALWASTVYLAARVFDNRE